MQGAFGYELDLSKLSEEDKEEAKKQIITYNKYYELFQKGTYYRLTSPYENPDYTAWSYVAKDQKKASVSVVYTDQHANGQPMRLKLKGLKKDSLYEVEGKSYSGAALMQGGILLPRPGQNYDSYMVVIQEK